MLRLAMLLLSAALAQGMLKSELPRSGNLERSPRALSAVVPQEQLISDARKTLEPLAPMVIKLDMCGGSFKPLIDGMVMGVMLGMQILLPSANMMFDMWHSTREMDSLYYDYWCSGANTQDAPQWLSSVWCSDPSPKSFYNSQHKPVEEAFHALLGTDSNVEILTFTPNAKMKGRDLLAMRGILTNMTGDDGGRKRVLMKVQDCSLFNLNVGQSDTDLWSTWWRVSDALDFAEPMKTASDRIISAIKAFSESARQRAEARGFRPLNRLLVSGGAFNVLHLQASQAWVQHCNTWMGLKDGVHRDNCMNNTQSIAEVLVTEGLDPRLPLYVDTPLTTVEFVNNGNAEIRGQYGPGFRGLTEAFTVITKGTILQSLHMESSAKLPVQMAAVDFLVASAANDYVGNSVAEESAHIMMVRQHQGKSAWHYNGGATPLRESGTLKPVKAMSIPTFSQQVKWVFAIHVGEGNLSKSFVDMVKVAVLSARRHTSLVPVCVTTAEPTSAISTWLVSQGVRVVHHTPVWAPAMRAKVAELQSSPIYPELKARSHLYTDPDAMIGTFMRIDIPILGILDEFVLYTDVDVIFKAEVDWSALLEGTDLDSIKQTNDFARGKRNFSEPGPRGLPRYFSASSEIEMSEDPGMMNAGIMLLNLRSLRETYESFKDYIFNDPDLQWDEGPGDQGAIKSFYADPAGRPSGNFLPWVLNWKPYWTPNPEAKLVHFHGPKCSSDIEPYIQTREVHTEIFGFLLEGCTQNGDCESLCREFDAYLNPPTEKASL